MVQKVVIGNAELYLADCLDVLRLLPDNNVDSVITDPPYGLSFMGKRWDYDVPSMGIWAECLRVLKPGGHLLAFAGTRTQHRMAVRIEDAGFEIRDMIAWVYGSGFPKSLDVSKAIDKAAGAEPLATGEFNRASIQRNGDGDTWEAGAFASHAEETKRVAITSPATEAARQWQGWGTALKPALEPITVARKPLIGTVAENVLEHGTGAINIDGCRVVASAEDIARAAVPQPKLRPDGKDSGHALGSGEGRNGERFDMSAGRWPANLIHDGSEEVLALAGEQARFFYCAKASKSDRGDGNAHPTVKPTDLMRYLCRLVTPPGGLVLDPFTGSGSTGKAALLEGFRFIGIEREAEYFEIACERIQKAVNQGQLLTEPVKQPEQGSLLT